MTKDIKSNMDLKKFSWNITFKWKIDTSKLKYQFLETYMEDWTINLLIFWKTKSISLDELLLEFTGIWEITDTDITHEADWKIVLLNNKVEWTIYELVSFEWVEICFEEILERFAESIEIVSIRESKDSKKFANKIIKADFIY